MIRTLIVEDNPSIAEINVEYVSRLPQFAVVATATSVATTLQHVATGQVDLILLDFGLPDAPGLQVCSMIHARSSAPDVIAVTAARDAETVRHAVSLGVVQYLIKPYTFAAFSAKLRSYAEYRERLGSSKDLDQQELDRSFDSLRGPKRGELPKGLSRPTLELVSGTLQRAPDLLSASEVASAVGISRVSARRYLEYLCAQQLVTLTPDYGRVGRPLNRYRWHV